MPDEKNGKTSARRRGSEEKIKQKIYVCAMQLFRSRGFDNVKVTDICETAEVAVGTFYYYFPSKEAVLLGFADVIDARIREKFKELENCSPSEKLKALFNYKLSLMLESGQELVNISSIAALKHNCDDPFLSKRAMYEYFLQAIEEGIRSGEFRSDLNMYTLTSMYRYCLGGLMFHWAINPEGVDAEREGERLANTFLSMLCPERR